MCSLHCERKGRVSARREGAPSAQQALKMLQVLQAPMHNRSLHDLGCSPNPQGSLCYNSVLAPFKISALLTDTHLLSHTIPRQVTLFRKPVPNNLFCTSVP